MNKIVMLDLSFNVEGETRTLHPVVLVGGGDVVLVDCGYAGFLPMIEEQLTLSHINPASLTKVYITHHDDDHMGALYELKQKYPHVQVVTHEREADYVAGKKKSLRLTQAEALLETMPEEQKSFGIAFCEMLKSVKPVDVDFTVSDGALLNWAGGCEILPTPGHMPGHTALYLKAFEAVITGDAAVIEDGKLAIANPHYSLDLEEAQTSLQRLRGLNAKVYYAYHGGALFNE